MEHRDNNEDRYSTMRSDLPMRTDPPMRRETTLRIEVRDKIRAEIKQ